MSPCSIWTVSLKEQVAHFTGIKTCVLWNCIELIAYRDVTFFSGSSLIHTINDVLGVLCWEFNARHQQAHSGLGPWCAARQGFILPSPQYHFPILKWPQSGCYLPLGGGGVPCALTHISLVGVPLPSEARWVSTQERAFSVQEDLSVSFSIAVFRQQVKIFVLFGPLIASICPPPWFWCYCMCVNVLYV